jgi:N-acetylglutamate synthase-like GNAT family acetyltransferase
MSEITLEPIPGADAGLKQALSDSNLPTDDVEEPGRVFFRAVGADGDTVGYSGIEQCGEDVLLRSLVVLPEHRGRTFGGLLTEETLSAAGYYSSAFLATTTAAAFFEQLGFKAVDRTDVPTAVLSTRQLSGICPASATIMKLTRPPT